MLNRVSALSLVLGVVGGDAVRGTGVTAQTSLGSVPVAVGDKVTLIFPQVSMDRNAPEKACTVMEFYGSYARCELPNDSREAADWVNLSRVGEIVKHTK